jgi:hypothetical protein
MKGDFWEKNWVFLRDKLSPKKLAEVATFFLRPKGFQEAYLFVMLLAKQANLKYKLKYPT